MPKPGPKVIAEALKSHKKSLTTPFSVPEDHLQEATAFARGWAKRKIRNTSIQEHFAIGDGACVEFGRAQGGLGGWVRARLNGYEVPESEGGDGEWLDATAPVLDLDESKFAEAGCPLDGVALETAKVRATMCALAELTGHARPLVRRLSNGCKVYHDTGLDRGVPKAVVVPLAEYGHKCRVITKSPAALVYTAHQARRKLLAGLRKTEEVGPFIEGDLDRGLDRFMGAKGRILSSDFRAASDLIPLSLAGALVDGLIQSGRFSPAEEAALRLSTGAMDVVWPKRWPPTSDDGEKESQWESPTRSQRGLLMGLPCTWALLTLAHLFWWKRALRKATRSEAAAREQSAVFACFGDDALIVAEDTVLDAYEATVKEGGMEISPGKHCRSSRYGIFLENLLTFDGSKVQFKYESLPVLVRERVPVLNPKTGTTRLKPRLVEKVNVTFGRGIQVGRISLDPAIPLRGLVYPDAGADTLGSRPMRLGTPNWMALGTVVETLVRQKRSAARIFRVQSRLHPRLMQIAKKSGLPWMPRALGGSGLLASELGWSEVIPKCGATVQHRKALASLLTDNSPERNPSAYSDAWRSAAQGLPEWVFEEARNELLGTVDEDGLWQSRSGCPYRWQAVDPEEGPRKGWIHAPDLVRDSAVNNISMLELVMSVERLPWTPGRVKAMVNGVTRELIERWKSAKPVKMTVSHAMGLHASLAVPFAFQHPPTWNPGNDGARVPEQYRTLLNDDEGVPLGLQVVMIEGKRWACLPPRVAFSIDSTHHVRQVMADTIPGARGAVDWRHEADPAGLQSQFAD
jgi:hypothetical protein